MSVLTEALSEIAGDRIVDNRVYTDQDVYDAEIERIHDRAWHFVAHESELPEVGDFITTNLGGVGVIVTRDRSRTLRAFYNTCRHRGAEVVADERGNCPAFQCPYHFWTYGLDGTLTGLPGEEAYDGTGFRKENFPLVSLRCESVLGLVWVCMDEDQLSLEDWIGPEMVKVLSTPLADAEFEVHERGSDELGVNWKVFAENARDGYHVPFVHPFFAKASPPGEYHLFDHGMAVQHLGMDPDGCGPELWEKLRQHPLPGVEVGEGYIVNVFPDFTLTLRSNVVSIDYQRWAGPTTTFLDNITLGLVGDTEQVRELRALSQKTWFSDPVELEDVPVFYAQQRGTSSRKVRHSIIARGTDATTGTRGDDNRLRQFWVQWREMMGVPGNSLSAE